MTDNESRSHQMLVRVREFFAQRQIGIFSELSGIHERKLMKQASAFRRKNPSLFWVTARPHSGPTERACQELDNRNSWVALHS